MDHDIEIGNAKSGGQWDALDRDAGDLYALSKYLEEIGKSWTFRCVRANELIFE